MGRLLNDFADNLQEENGMAPATVYGMVRNIRFFFHLNGVRLRMPYRRSRWSIYEERAPTPEELQKTISVADIRGKVIIALMAVGGFRNGTLVQLKYRHVKRDLEARAQGPGGIFVTFPFFSIAAFDLVFQSLFCSTDSRP
jgi:integrase